MGAESLPAAPREAPEASEEGREGSHSVAPWAAALVAWVGCAQAPVPTGGQEVLGGQGAPGGLASAGVLSQGCLEAQEAPCRVGREGPSRGVLAVVEARWVGLGVEAEGPEGCPGPEVPLGDRSSTLDASCPGRVHAPA
mmetsp:Transcript_42656/g.101280  ORF Transcript_42656/g.101280 Transcript_42656/m.101280 type:complete len:139 (+) Transcript_42656:1640-2056(+)